MREVALAKLPFFPFQLVARLCLQVLSCASVVLEYVAFIILRVKQPNLKRPFRVGPPVFVVALLVVCAPITWTFCTHGFIFGGMPNIALQVRGPLWLICIGLLPSLAIAAIVMGYGCFTSWQLAVPNLVALSLGFGLYGCMRASNYTYVRRRRASEEESEEENGEAGPRSAVVSTHQVAPVSAQRAVTSGYLENENAASEPCADDVAEDTTPVSLPSPSDSAVVEERQRLLTASASLAAGPGYGSAEVR